MKPLLALLCLPLFTLPTRAARQPSPAVRVSALADRYVTLTLQYDPTQAYSAGLPSPDNSRFADRSPAALAAYDAAEQSILADLRAVPTANLSATTRVVAATLREQLESDLQLRVCRTELWSVNHFSGWQSSFAQIAEQQPVATPDDRAQALRRWSAAPRFLDTEIANLRRGLAAGYSAPQSVTRRVIAQMDSMIAAPPEKSPFFSPAARSLNAPSPDPAFKAAFTRILVEEINPALRRYRDFLVTEYLPKAREGVAISDLPNGPACYQAFLRQNTTLTRTPQQVFDLGQQTVAANLADVQRLGQQHFGTTDTPTLIERIKSRPEDHFQSADDLLRFSRAHLDQARAATAAYLIDQMPSQAAVVEPDRPFEEQAGVSSHFEPEPDPAKPATFRLELSPWKTETRGEATIVLVHEVWPGHHLQIALARQLQPEIPLFKLTGNSAYVEGWARYAEGMAEDVGLYADTPDALILRRLWPARGMVVDPGLHAFHWSRQQAIDYILAAGRDTPEAAADLIDRIAVLPGQLTSYDSGGLEIKALRHEAETRLGARFDLRAFNRAVLEEGVVPLSELRRHIEDYLATQTPKP